MHIYGIPENYKYCIPSLEIFYEMMKSKHEYIISYVMKYIFLALIKRQGHTENRKASFAGSVDPRHKRACFCCSKSQIGILMK